MKPVNGVFLWHESFVNCKNWIQIKSQDFDPFKYDIVNCNYNKTPQNIIILYIFQT